MNRAAVREAIADALAMDGVQTNPYVLAQPTPPGIQIPPPGATYNYTMRSNGNGLNEYPFVIQAFCALNSDIGAQRLLDEMCADTGPTSIKALLEADKTLGGLVDDLVVTDQIPGRQVEQPSGNPMLLVEFHVTVYAKGA
jgi:hypothetical protein